MSGFGSGIGAVVRIGTFVGGIAIALWGFFELESTAAIIAMAFVGVFVIGLGYGVSYQIARGQWQVPTLAPGSIFPSSRRSAGNRFVMHGFLWVILWMAVGGALSLAFLPLFPDVLVEWVDQGQKWALDLKAQLE